MATFDQIRSRFPSARGLSDNEIVEKLSGITKLPYEDVAQRFGYTEKTPTSFFGGANDLAIEAANSAAGMVSGIGEFVSPGNRFSKGIQENIIAPGEAKQTIPTALAKRALQRGMSTSEIGPQAGAVYDYITDNPGLAAAQAVGSFGPIGLAGKGVQAGSLAAGLGAKAAGRVGLGATAAVSGAAAGGDAGGDAYKLVMDTPREVLLAHPQAQALVEAGVTDVGQIYEELATRAARRASVVPAIIGAVSGATGAESALLRGVAGGAKGVVKKVGAEALGEGFEEGATTYSGRKSAQQYNPNIDPMAGVVGSGLMGGALGAGTALPVSLANMRPEQDKEIDLTARDTAPTTQGISTYRPKPVPESAFTPTSTQRDLFGTVGGPAPVSGEQIDMFGGGGQAQQQTVDERQGDMFAPSEPAFQTRITADLLDNLGLPRQSPMYRQLLGKDMADPAAQPQIAEVFSRVRDDASISPRTKAGVESLAMNAFGAMSQQQEMIGPRGGIYAQGRPSTQQNAAGPVENILPTQPLGAEVQQPAAATQVAQPAAPAPAAPVAMPVAPKGVKFTTEETRALKQAQGIFDIAETDADRRNVAAIATRLLSRAAQRAGVAFDPQVSPPLGAASAVQPATPVVAGSSSKGTADGAQTAKAQQTKTQGQELSAAESAQLSKLLSDAEGTDIGNVLPASVKSGGKAVPGRMRIDQSGLKRIRDALVLGKETADEKTGQIVDALRNFANSYKTYSDQGGQALSRRNKIAKKTNAAQFADEQSSAIEMQAANVQNALAELGDAVGGNAKDIEAVVRLVKDMVQGKLTAPGSNNKAVREELKKLDTMLSQAWAAAKRETLMGKEPDTADIRTGAIRGSIEVKGKGKVPTLVKIAKEGLYAGKDLGTLKGLPAILHYMRTNGTPMERALALALRESITGSESNIKLEFITEGKPRFDPKTNTVYLNQEESPEVILHEAFHAALQSFVYKNPNNPAVVQLKKSLKAVIGFKGNLTGNALEVQTLLKDLVANGNELDAVLELVSYGNTLNEFRKALQGMQSDKTIPKSFLESVSSAWTAIKNIASRLLGGKRSLANDVLESSLELLEKAQKQTAVTGQGNVLEAAVSSESQKAVDAEATTAMEAEAKEAGYASATEFASKQGAWKTPTQIAFEAIGLGRVNGKDLPLTTKFKENGAKVAQWVRVNVPTLERVTLNFNSKFSNGGLVNRLIETFKFDQNTGYLQMERISQHLHAHPELAKPFLAYMDGDSKALDGVKNNASMKAIADNLRGLMTKYIKSLPANSKERRAFDNVPFSQYLLHPDSIGQTAGTTMGVAKIGDLLKTEIRGETSIDEFKQYLSEREGSVDLNDPLYQMFEEKLGKVLPAGFISKAKYEQMGAAPAGMAVDASRIWKFAKFDGEKGQYTFESSSTAKQLAEGRKIEELSAALLNTTAALAHTYASRNFFNGLLTIGRDENGKPTANSVAFDTVDAINAAFTGRKISESNVLKVSDEASRSPQIRWKTQRTGTWVQLPENSPTYGALQGKIIPGPVWNSMIDMHDRAPLLNSRIINGVMTTFKKSKTVYNPGTHVTNVLSNVSLAILHGINFNTLGRATQMFVQFERNPNGMRPEDLALMKAFYNSGAVLGQFSSSEIKQTVYDKMNAAIEPDSDNSYMTRIKTFMKYEAAKAKVKEYDSKATEFYAAEDNVFRLAAFLNTAGNIQLRDGTNKLSEQQMTESGAAARNMFLDYDIDARAIRALRQSFLPFVSWPYAAAGVLGRIAIEKPWAMANMMMSIALIAAATGGEDDEEARKAGPKYLREKSLMGLGPYMHMRVPFMGDEQNPVYFNLGKYVPMFSLFQGAPGDQKTLGVELPGFATPGGPLVNAVSAMTGYDPFTGKPIAAPTDETWDRVVKSGKYLYNTMTPTLVGTKFWEQVGDLKDGKTGPLGVEKSSLFLARNLGGLGLYQFNVEESQFMQDKTVQGVKKDFSAAMSKAKRNEYSKGYPDYEALDAELDELQTRLEKRIAEIRGE